MESFNNNDMCQPCDGTDEMLSFVESVSAFFFEGPQSNECCAELVNECDKMVPRAPSTSRTCSCQTCAGAAATAHTAHTAGLPGDARKKKKPRKH